MENSEIIKVIQYHNNLLGFDCPCVLRANGELEVYDQSRMPKDDIELEKWRVEMAEDIASREYLTLRVYPNPMEYNDAKVKQASDDPSIQADGVAQEKKYLSDCLAVKEKWPKP